MGLVDIHVNTSEEPKQLHEYIHVNTSEEPKQLPEYAYTPMHN